MNPSNPGRANEEGGLRKQGKEPFCKAESSSAKTLGIPFIVQLKANLLSQEMFPRVRGNLKSPNEARTITTRSWKVYREYL